MTIVRRIHPASAFKVGVVVYGFLGLILGAFCSLIAVSGIAIGRHAHMPFARSVGVLAIIVCPIIYGIIGGIAAVVGAFLYNVASGWVGGVEVEIS